MNSTGYLYITADFWGKTHIMLGWETVCRWVMMQVVQVPQLAWYGNSMLMDYVSAGWMIDPKWDEPPLDSPFSRHLFNFLWNV